MLSRWNETWQLLGRRAPHEAFEHLNAAYSQPHRKYHTVQHLRECFALYDSIPASPAKTVHVELALWFHDVVYDPKATDNEAASAAWAEGLLRSAGLPLDTQQRVARLIELTRHAATPPEGDEEQLLVDVDLQILGASPQRFAQYEAQVRLEYHWVPEEHFRQARVALLKQFQSRPYIFQTRVIRGLLEEQARQNLARTIVAGSAGSRIFTL
jgi:predicted metal-dependent HD superfamily phosphohydrolase